MARLKELGGKLWRGAGTAGRLPIVIGIVILLAWVPLYRILFPPLVDLPEHLLISKLLWEKLNGISHLDLQISWFLGYRLLPVVLLAGMAFCKVFGISLLLLPRMVALGFVGLHAVVILGLLSSRLKNRTWWGWALATCLALPAVVCLYSACWFIGFINYTFAITLLIPAVFLSERFLRDARLADALLLLANLALVYAAHPFGPIFWILWCGARTLAAFATGTVFTEWKRLVLLLAIVLPIFTYHFAATRKTSLAPSNHSLLTQSPVLPIQEWYKDRVTHLIDGTWLKADDAAQATTFARFALAFILAGAVCAFVRGTKRTRNVMLAAVILLFGASWVNEKFIPVPPGAWLAYEYRFYSTTIAIGLAFSGLVLIDRIPGVGEQSGKKIIFVLLAAVSVFASISHLVDVRKAYVRNDRQARRYMARVLRHEAPHDIHLPHSRWHPDGTLIRLYSCLEQPDCNPEGTTFYTGYVSDLYPVKFRSRTRVLSAREQAVWRNHVPAGPLVGHWQFDETNPTDPCLDSSGNGYNGSAVGTTMVEGKLKGARSFSGFGDYVEIPPISVSDAITVSVWIYSDRFLQNGFVVTKNPVNSQWALFFEAGSLKWRSVGNSNNVVCPAPANGKWHHLLARQDGPAASLFIDGKLAASGSLPPIGNAPTKINIGRYDSPSFSYFVGRVDDVRIYNRALPDTEVLALFAEGNNSAPAAGP